MSSRIARGHRIWSRTLATRRREKTKETKTTNRTNVSCSKEATVSGAVKLETVEKRCIWTFNFSIVKNPLFNNTPRPKGSTFVLLYIAPNVFKHGPSCFKRYVNHTSFGLLRYSNVLNSIRVGRYQSAPISSVTCIETKFVFVLLLFFFTIQTVYKAIGIGKRLVSNFLKNRSCISIYVCVILNT